MKSLKLYQYDNCDSCRKAKKFLRQQGIEFESIPIREQPPSRTELSQMLESYGGNIRRLFNTSGLDYRRGGYKEKLPEMSAEEAIAELAASGNLIKRPFLIADGLAVVGFKADEWAQLLESW